MNVNMPDISNIAPNSGYSRKNITSNSSFNGNKEEIKFVSVLQKQDSHVEENSLGKDASVSNNSAKTIPDSEKTADAETDTLDSAENVEDEQQKIKKVLEDSGLDVNELLLLLSALAVSKSTESIPEVKEQVNAAVESLDKLPTSAVENNMNKSLSSVIEKLAAFFSTKIPLEATSEAENISNTQQGNLNIKKALELISSIKPEIKDSGSLQGFIENILQSNEESKTQTEKDADKLILSLFEPESDIQSQITMDTIKEKIIQQISSLFVNEAGSVKNNAPEIVVKNTEVYSDSKINDIFTDEKDTIAKLQSLINDDSKDKKLIGRVVKRIENQTSDRSIIVGLSTNGDNEPKKDTNVNVQRLKNILSEIKDQFVEPQSQSAAKPEVNNFKEQHFDIKANLSSEQETDSPEEAPKVEKILENIITPKNTANSDKMTLLMNQLVSKTIDSPVSEVAKLTINRNNFTADLIKAVKYMDLNDMKELTVRIAPKELGEVVIKLTMESGNMKASITANNKETYNILNSSILDIKQGLGNSDIKIQNVTVNIYQGDTTFFKDGSNQNHNQDNHQRKRTNLREIGSLDDNSVNAQEQISDDSNINMLA